MASRREGFSTALANLRTDLYAQAAGRYVTNVEQNIPKVPFILGEEVLRQAIQSVGYEFAPEGKKPAPSDHVILAIQRELVRSPYYRDVKPKTRRTKTLVVGAAAREIAMYYHNPNVHFYVHGNEAKDPDRLISLLEDALEMISGAAVPLEPGQTLSGLKHATGRATAKLSGLKEVLAFYEGVHPEFSGRTRIYTSEDEVLAAGPFGTLLFEDSAYNLTEEDWFRWFAVTRAHTAHVLGFYPHELLFPGKIRSRLHNVEFLEAREVSTMLAASAVLPALGANAQFWTGNVAAAWALTKITAGVLKFAWAFSGEPTVDGLTAFGILEGERWLRAYDVKVPTIGSMHSLAKELAVALAIKVVSSWRTRRVQVTYKDGHANGYVHSEYAWTTLIKKPVLTSLSHQWKLHNEIRNRAGEMYHFVISRCSDIDQRIARTISLPQCEEWVELLDVMESFDFHKKVWKEPKYHTYMKVKRREAYDVANYLGRLDPSSHTKAGTMAMICRAYVGVSISTVEYAPRWDADQGDLSRIAVSLTMYGMKEAEDSAEVIGQLAKLRDLASKTNLQDWIDKVLEGVVSVMTLGLNVPLWRLYLYLTGHNGCPIFIREQPASVTQTWEPTYGSRLYDTTIKALGGKLAEETPEDELEFEASFDIVGAKDVEKPACRFVQSLGDIGDQVIKCEHGNDPNPREISVEFTTEEMAVMRAQLVEQRNAATAELRQTIDAAINNLPVQGFKTTFEVELIRGAFGTGKSYICRKYIEVLADSHEKSLVHAPFSKLAPDYTEIDTKGKNKFDFYTTHKAFTQRGKDVIISDEYTAMESNIGLVVAYVTGAKRLVLVGDEGQTGVMPTEGVRYFRGNSKIRMTDAWSHVLTRNFRNGKWAVAWANYFHPEHYCVYAQNEQLDIPVVKPLTEASRVTFPLMAYSNETCRFVMQSAIGEENTVRKNQGGTLPNLGIVIREGDINMLDIDELNRVAFTRVKAGGQLVFFCDEGPAKTRLEQVLGFNDEYFMANIETLARPDIDAIYSPDKKVLKSRAQEYIALAIERKQIWYAGKVVGHENDDVLRKVDQFKTAVEKIQGANAKKKTCQCGAVYTGPKSSCASCLICYGCGGYRDPDYPSPYCSGCTRTPASALDADQDWAEIREEDPEFYNEQRARTAHNYLEVDSWDDDGKFQYCLVRAALSPVEEDENTFSARMRKYESLSIMRRAVAQVPVRETLTGGLKPGSFVGFKDYLLEKLGTSSELRRIPVDVFQGFLDSKHLRYLILEYNDSGTKLIGARVPSDFIPGGDFAAIATCAGHATPIPFAVLCDWTTPGLLEVRRVGGSVSRIQVTPYHSIKSVSALYQGETFDKPMPGYDEGIPLGLWMATKGTALKEGLKSRSRSRQAVFPMIHENFCGGISAAGKVWTSCDVKAPKLIGNEANLLAESKVGPFVHEDFGYQGTEDINDPADSPGTVKERFGGYDAYKLYDCFDSTWLKQDRLNAVGAGLGPQVPLGSFWLDLSALYAPLKKNRRPKATVERARAVTAGLGLHQTNSELETVGCISRYFGRKRVTRPSIEGLTDARKMAEKNFRDRYDPERKPDQAFLDTVNANFYCDARKRNYDGRAEALFRAYEPDRTVTFSNKAQFKPAKGGKVDLFKVGQGISATSAAINLKYGSFFRQLTAAQYLQQRPENIFDIYKSTRELGAEVNRQVSQLAAPKAITVDQKECDANQNWHSMEAERVHWILVGGDPAVVNQYFVEVRQMYPIKCYGLLSGTVKEAKPSGAPDTLPGNSAVTELYGNRIVKGKGPRVTVKKGDDFAIWQNCAEFDEEERKQVRKFANIEQTVVEGEAEFCGMTSTDRGLMPNPIRTARKAAAYRAKDYKAFAQYQISLRDALAWWKTLDVDYMCVSAALASKLPIPLGRAALEFVESFSHISEAQWYDITTVREHHKAANPSAAGVPQWF